MTVDDWVYEAVEAHRKAGATIREIQKYIDDHHYEELAIDTLEASLEKLRAESRVDLDGTRWKPAVRTTKEDALRRLFGDG